MEELMEILKDLHPEVDFETEEHLIDDGIFDSFDIVTLVSEIREEFGVTIGVQDLVPENLNSAKALYALEKRLEDGE